MSIIASQRALIVDDEPLIAIALEDFLSDIGVGEVRSAMNCEAARECILKEWPTFVILDISLPDGSGYALADLLAANGISFVFSSGIVEEDIPPRFCGAKALGKPIDYDDLAKVLHQIASRQYADSS